MIILDLQLLAAVDEIHSDLEAEGVKVFVYGKSRKYESFTDALEGARTTNPDASIRKGW